MPRRRALPGVLHNFLETFLSRYSAHRGHWIFGFLIDDLTVEEFDLLSASDDEDGVWGVLRSIARARFAEQLRANGFSDSPVREARLRLEKRPGGARGLRSGYVCDGFSMSALVAAVTDNGTRFERTSVVFVAPHDPAREARSVPSRSTLSS